MIKQETMTGAVHRLQSEDLLLDLRREHVLGVMLMSGAKGRWGERQRLREREREREKEREREREREREKEKEREREREREGE